MMFLHMKAGPDADTIRRGGLIRSAGGWMALKSGKEEGGRTKGDERIHGEGKLVESVLDEADEKIERR